MDKELSVVGKDVTRLDSKAKVTGEATFTVDVKLPGMLHAKFLRSPHAHARIRSIDCSEAEAVPGVWGIITQKDLIGSLLHKDRVDDKLRFLGDAVAGVAAETEQAALQALELIEVSYDVMENVFDSEKAFSPDAPRIWPGGNLCTWGGAVTPDKGPGIHWKKGDLDSGFSEADVVIENRVKTHAQFHCCFEPHTCVAKWDPGLRELTFWVSTQSMYNERENLARFLKLPLEKVRVICTYTGGGFGSKVHNTMKEYLMTALLSVKVRKPVRYEPTRDEEVISAVRHPADFYYKMGAKKDGTLTAVYLKTIRSGGAHTSLQNEFLRGSVDYVVPAYYMCPNMEYEGWSAYTTLPVCSAYRGFGYFESGTAMVQTMDMLSEAIGMDPLEFQIKNVPPPGYLIGAVQGPITTKGIKETIIKCGEAIGWKEKWHKPGVKTLSDGRKHGIGLGYALGPSMLPHFVTLGSAILKLQMDGKVHVMAGISDMGQGQATGLCQIAAEALGVSFEDVTITWGDSIAPHSNFQAGSATTMLTGNAIKLAAADAKEQLFKLAEPLLEVKPEEMAVKEGRIYSKADPKRHTTIAKVVSLPGVMTIVAHGRWTIPYKEAYPRAPAICIAEVAIDTETGEVALINMVQGTECGQVICRKRVEGQMQGVLSGGVGFVLFEDWIMDQTRGGRIMNANFLDYKIVTTLDTMDILEPPVIVEDPDPLGPFGARGMGETTLAASGPALLNAIYNAIGVRFYNTPITQDKILKALGEAR